MRISVFLSLFVLFIACTTNPNQQENSVVGPLLIADAPTSAKAKNGQYIYWKEYLIDDVSITGVEISGSDGLVLADLDKDGIEDIISVHEVIAYLMMVYFGWNKYGQQNPHQISKLQELRKAQKFPCHISVRLQIAHIHDIR